jgi:hypothetical protein
MDYSATSTVSHCAPLRSEGNGTAEFCFTSLLPKVVAVDQGISGEEVRLGACHHLGGVQEFGSIAPNSYPYPSPLLFSCLTTHSESYPPLAANQPSLGQG